MNDKNNEKTSVLKKVTGLQEFNIIVILAVIIIFASIALPAFLTASNIRTTLIGVCANGIVAIAMAICLISGAFDLSVGSVMGLSCVVTVILTNAGLNVWLAALISLGIGLLIGVIDGFLVGYVGLNAFITTLGMEQVGRGLVSVLTNGGSIAFEDADKVAAFRIPGSGSIGQIPIFVIILIVCVAVADVVTRKTGIARNLFFVGSNEKTAILSGINTKKVRLVVFSLSGLICAFAGVLTASRFNMGTTSTGSGIEMTILSGAVIGGVSLAGGKGTILGAVLGVVMMGLISDVLVIMNISINWQSAITGMILIIAILFDAFSSKGKKK